DSLHFEYRPAWFAILRTCAVALPASTHSLRAARHVTADPFGKAPRRSNLCRGKSGFDVEIYHGWARASANLLVALAARDRFCSCSSPAAHRAVARARSTSWRQVPARAAPHGRARPETARAH